MSPHSFGFVVLGISVNRKRLGSWYFECVVGKRRRESPAAPRQRRTPMVLRRGGKKRRNREGEIGWGEGAMNTGQRRGEGQVEYWKLAM